MPEWLGWTSVAMESEHQRGGGVFMDPGLGARDVFPKFFTVDRTPVFQTRTLLIPHWASIIE